MCSFGSGSLLFNFSFLGRGSSCWGLSGLYGGCGSTGMTLVVKKWWTSNHLFSVNSTRTRATLNYLKICGSWTSNWLSYPLAQIRDGSHVKYRRKTFSMARFVTDILASLIEVYPLLPIDCSDARFISSHNHLVFT